MDWISAERLEEGRESPPHTLWPVELKLMHVACNPSDTLVHIQGQYLTVCELDYKILQFEIQNAPKTSASLEIGEYCLVEDILSGRWFRGRVQNKSQDLVDVFLLDYGNILSVAVHRLSGISDTLLMLPPKIVCGFIANVLPAQEAWDMEAEKYYLSLIGGHVKGYIHGLLPHKVLILEVPEITKDLLRRGLGRHVDTHTFLMLVEMLVGVPIQQSCESVPDLLLEKQVSQEVSFKTANLIGFKNVFLLSSPTMAVGLRERVRITAAVHLGLFYCQLSSVEKDVKEMSENLALACESKGSIPRGQAVENLGLLCAIKGKDEKWHRGFVQCLPVNSQVRVVFIDYGYCESVKVENIHHLPSEFLPKPFMAFPCSLCCLRNTDRNVKQQQLALLRDGLMGKELEVLIDSLSKDQNIHSVTLSSVTEDTKIKSVQSAEAGQPKNMLRIEHSITCDPNQHTVRRENQGGSLQPGSVFEGYIEHAQSPHDFWMRTAERNDHFEAMMDKLMDHCSRLQLNEEVMKDPEPGALCCAMYEKDLQYYRAKVVDTLQNGAEVFFIDFGNTEKVPGMLIKELPEEFTVEREFAFHCSLAHVAPVEDVWRVAEIEFFRRATSNKALLTHVVRKIPDRVVVELYEQRLEKNENIASLMTKENMAYYWGCSFPTVPVGQKTDKTPGQQEWAKHCVSSLEAHISGNVGGQEVAVGTASSITKRFMPHSCPPGSEMSVICSHISSPSDFWCQNKKLKRDLDKLMNRLQAYYQRNSPEWQPQSTVCAVKLHRDDQWYRGCIFAQKAKEFEVLLVDYGMTVQTKVQDLRDLPPEFLEPLAHAFRCSLYNLIEPVEERKWPKEATALLTDFVSGASNSLKCTIYSRFITSNKIVYNVVELYTPLQRATSHLVEKGLAVAIQNPKELLPLVHPGSFVYSAFGINIGSEEVVYCTHVTSPWEVYLQLNRNTEVLEALTESMTEVSKCLSSQKLTGEIAEGSICLAKYLVDNKWYRSFVWNSQSSLHCNVFFVDYGNKQVAEKNSVLPIPREAVDLLFTPMQALKCSLHGIKEEEPLPGVNEWFKKNVLNKKLRARFVAKNDSGCFSCDLFDGAVHINKRVQELFSVHAQKKGSPVKQPTSKDIGPSPIKDNSAKKKTKKNSQSLYSAQSRYTARTGLAKRSLDIKRSPIKPTVRPVEDAQGKKNQKVPSPQKRTVRKVKANAIQPGDRLPRLSDLPEVQITRGFKDVGFISHGNSAHSFFVQMDKDEQRILKIGEELNDLGSREMKGLTSKVRVGDLVVAEYSEDQALYRAVVTSVPSTISKFITVEFIDYGNSAIVGRDKINPLPKAFLSEPRQCVSCTLRKADLVNNVECFISEAHGKPLMIEFLKQVDNAWEVRMELLESGACRADGKNTNEAELNPDPSTKTQSLRSTEIIKTGIQDDNQTDNDIKVLDLVDLDDQQEDILDPDTQNASEPRVFQTQLGNINDKSCADLRLRVEKSAFVDTSLEKPILQVVEAQPASKDTSLENPMRLHLAPVAVEQEYNGFAATVSTPGHFFIVLEDLLFTMNTISNVLLNLPEELSSLPETHLVKGAGCLMKADDMRRWCRAEVLHCNDTFVILRAVDYGHCVYVARQDLHMLKVLSVELAALPKIMYPCKLRGIKPVDEKHWSDDANGFFQDRMHQKCLQIFFRQFVPEEQWEVDVIIAGRNIAGELVRAGYATYTDPLLGIQFEQMLETKRRTEQQESTPAHVLGQPLNLQAPMWTSEEAPQTLTSEVETQLLKDDAATWQDPHPHGVPNGMAACSLM